MNWWPPGRGREKAGDADQRMRCGGDEFGFVKVIVFAAMVPTHSSPSHLSDSRARSLSPLSATPGRELLKLSSTAFPIIIMDIPTPTLDALVFSGGSIAEAIAQSRRHKKLFLVYISGQDDDSLRLQHSTWIDQTVHQIIPRYCIFLHLLHGTLDASQFSAIYPHNSVPSISAIGLNGVLLWHHEGYIDAENLRENIEKSFATLHLQETAATLLTAALATQNPAPVSDASAANASSAGGPALSNTPSTSSSTEARISNVAPNASSNRIVDTTNEKRSPRTGVVSIAEEHQNRDEAEAVSSRNEAPSIKGLKHETVEEKDESSATTSSEMNVKSEKIPIKDVVEEKTESSATTTSEMNVRSEKIPRKDVVKSNDMHLNIRMPDGASLQIKLVKSDALSSVKNFVDEQQDTQANSYNLAVPYPRKLFNEEDMDRTLSELGFSNRETLIVVPHQSTRSLRPHPVSNNGSNTSQDGSNDNGTGYFGLLRRVMSYVNPFSYLGGNTSVDPNAPTNNHGLSAGEGVSQATQSSNNTRQRSTSRSFGSNIHTLRPDDDGTDPPRDRNTFWNGNSTQFGSSDQQ